jgi:hypothetical protein
MTYFVYESWWGREYSHHATVHLAHCSHCNNGQGRKGAQDVTNSLSKWLGPFSSFHQAKDAAAQTGRKVKLCGVCGPY